MPTPPAASSHELDAPPWRRVDATLMATARAIRETYDGRLAVLGLNLSQASLLALLQEFGPHTQSRLATRLQLGRAATGALVDALERKGLVGRAADPDDRRVWMVDVTPAGAVAAGQVAEVDRAVRAQMRSGFTRDERQLLAGMLLRLQANLTAG